MRNIEAELLVKKSAREVWKRAASLPFWKTLTDSYGRFGRRLVYTVVEPAEGKETLGPGSLIQVRTGWGRRWLDWRVTEFRPPKRLVLSATEDQSWLNTYHMSLELTLDSVDDDKTRVNAVFYALFLNRAVELASLLLPVRFLYTGGVNRALKSLTK